MTLLNRIRYLPYRIVRRLGTADISCIFGIETEKLQTPNAVNEFAFAEISELDIRKMVTTYPETFGDTQASQLNMDNVYCVAMFQGQQLAGFAWLATGNIPAEFNHDGDLRAGLPLFLPSDTGYVYNVFVVPEHRGKRLYASIMHSLAEVMRPRGVTRLILTTDATNRSSLKALRRMGFQEYGQAWFFCLGPFSIASYPPTPVFGNVRFGTYTGDRRAVQLPCTH